MIVFIHNKHKVISITSTTDTEKILNPELSLSETLLNLSEKYPNEFIFWCHIDLQNFINYEALSLIFHHKLIFASYHYAINPLFSNAIGYVDETNYVSVNKNVKSATWIMSSCVGGIYAGVINALALYLKNDSNFDYFLTSIARNAMKIGLTCISEPNLLVKPRLEINNIKSNNYILSKFISQHFRIRWLLILFLCKLLFEKQIVFFPIIKALFYINRKFPEGLLKEIEVKSTLNLLVKCEIDVIIPTIGRKKYLLDVLNDFASQTIKPKRIIIIEQDATKNSTSELDYLQNKIWPFEIVHKFIHKTGACNARNTAIALVESEWTFFADDDIRFNENFIEDVFKEIKKYQNEIFLISCLLKGEKNIFNIIQQWDNFGAGCSFVKSSCLKELKFNMNYEFGYSEDADFGCQLAQKGFDILFLPYPKILHLKAQIGGFRMKFQHYWLQDKIQPKPFPTVMYFKLLNRTKEQLNGYKLLLFFKYYPLQNIKNPIKYFSLMSKQWKKSKHIATKLFP